MSRSGRNNSCKQRSKLICSPIGNLQKGRTFLEGISGLLFNMIRLNKRRKRLGYGIKLCWAKVRGFEHTRKVEERLRLRPGCKGPVSKQSHSSREDPCHA